MATKLIKTRDELLVELQEQLLMLEELCKLYDEGKEFVVKEIAVKLRVIFHNKDKSKSVFHQLKLKMQLYDSCAPYNPKKKLTQHNLLLIKLSDSSAKYLPIGWEKTPYKPKLVNFESWWNHKKIVVDKFGKSFNRRKIILEVANTDGGAHVDSELDADYYNLSRDNSLGWIIHSIKEPLGVNINHLNNPVPPMLRQIANEVIETFRFHNINIINHK